MRSAWQLGNPPEWVRRVGWLPLQDELARLEPDPPASPATEEDSPDTRSIDVGDQEPARKKGRLLGACRSV